MRGQEVIEEDRSRGKKQHWSREDRSKRSSSSRAPARSRSSNKNTSQNDHHQQQ